MFTWEQIVLDWKTDVRTYIYSTYILLWRKEKTSNGLVHTNHIKHILHLPFIWYLVRQFGFYSLRISYTAITSIYKIGEKNCVYGAQNLGKLKTQQQRACPSKMSRSLWIIQSVHSLAKSIFCTEPIHLSQRALKSGTTHTYNTVYPLMPASRLQK